MPQLGNNKYDAIEFLADDKMDFNKDDLRLIPILRQE